MAEVACEHGQAEANKLIAEINFDKIFGFAPFIRNIISPDVQAGIVK